MTVSSASAVATNRHNLWSLRALNVRRQSRDKSAGLLGALVLLVLISSTAFAQYGGGPAKLTIKSSVLGEDRTILVRTPPGKKTTIQTPRSLPQTSRVPATN
jgi:hypothetical protein